QPGAGARLGPGAPGRAARGVRAGGARAADAGRQCGGRQAGLPAGGDRRVRMVRRDRPHAGGRRVPGLPQAHRRLRPAPRHSTGRRGAATRGERADMSNVIPEGYMRNALCHLVPVEQVREQDKLRDEAARALATEAVELNRRLTEFKRRSLGEIADLVQIAAERYGERIGGEKGNVAITTYDGEYKVTRTYAERLAFTEELEVAKALVNACI